MDTPLIRIRDLCKSYTRGDQTIPVLSGITFDIAQGEFLALVGPSGSGKSTLLNLIAGIDTADSGHILVGGTDVVTLSEGELADWRSAHVGFIFQFYNLIPVLTALENVELPLLLTRLSRAERREHAAHALAAVTLSARMDHRPAPLSGGAANAWPSPGPSGRPGHPRGPTCPPATGPGLGRGHPAPLDRLNTRTR
jgi:putative ABC transport system ATP-binding protein